MKYFLVVSAEVLHSIMFLMPRYRLLNGIKSLFLRLVWGAKVGRRTVYYSGVRIFPGNNLVVGDDVDFAKGVQVYTSGGLEIGDRVLIGFGSMIITSNHRVPKAPAQIFHAGNDKKKVVIEKDAWIGGNCTILPGVTIGEGAVVAAGAVVSKDVAPFSIVGGVPAKEIRKRD